MKIEKSTTVITLSEEDLKKAIQYWLLVVHRTDIDITHLEHLSGYRTESCGIGEFDVPYQEGVKLLVVDKPSMTYNR